MRVTVLRMVMICSSRVRSYQGDQMTVKEPLRGSEA
jgi:hypothetical protein